MESIYTVAIFAVLFIAFAVPYWYRVKRHRREAERKFEKNAKAGNRVPVTLHPKIDLLSCIGCASCVRACPEHVLGIVHGRAALVNGLKCVGHGLCADVCPVGAITLGFGTPRQGMELPFYDENLETNLQGLYIVGELGGVGLIKNAVSQGIKAIEHIARTNHRSPAQDFDVIIVGAGPAGLAAALAAQSKKLRYTVLEQDDIGGSVLHYPRQKLVLTSPVDLPQYGRLKAKEISKEDLLAVWKNIVSRFRLNILTGQKVESIQQLNSHFIVTAGSSTFSASKAVLAIGRRGSPKKLGVPGESLPKVMYRLIEAETYQQTKCLVVGGGDSAVEATVALASQSGNVVTLSYRREEFVRLKEKNEQRIQEYMQAGKVRVIFNSNVVEIGSESVLLQESGKTQHLPNDYVFVLVGGELPGEFLKRTGVKFRTSEVSVGV